MILTRTCQVFNVYLVCSSSVIKITKQQQQQPTEYILIKLLMFVVVVLGQKIKPVNKQTNKNHRSTDYPCNKNELISSHLTPFLHF